MSLDPDNPCGIDTRDPAEYQAALGQFRFEKLRRQIRYLWTNEDYFRPRFVAVGVASPDDIASLYDCRRRTHLRVSAIPSACI